MLGVGLVSLLALASISEIISALDLAGAGDCWAEGLVAAWGAAGAVAGKGAEGLAGGLGGGDADLAGKVAAEAEAEAAAAAGTCFKVDPGAAADLGGSTDLTVTAPASVFSFLMAGD